jgi:hypothetical protein
MTQVWTLISLELTAIAGFHMKFQGCTWRTPGKLPHLGVSFIHDFHRFPVFFLQATCMVQIQGRACLT